MNANKKFYQKNWFIYLCMLIFPPAGIALLWIYNKKSSTKFKGIISVIAAIWFVLLITSDSSTPTDTDKMASNENSLVTESASVESEIQTESMNDTQIEEDSITVSEISSENEISDTNENFLLNCDLTIRNVMNGSGDTVIGKCAFIRITDEQLKEITSDLLKDFADNVVSGSEYNWVSIATDSDTGLFFGGSDPSYVVYGKLDKDGGLLDTYGICLLDSSGKYIYTESDQESVTDPNSEIPINDSPDDTNTVTSTQLFEQVYVPYANREKSFVFYGVKTYVSTLEYDIEITEPNEDILGEIKIIDTNGDYVFLSFFPVNDIDMITLVNYHCAETNREVSMENYSANSSPQLDSFTTHIIGEGKIEVSGTDEQRNFLFHENVELESPATPESNSETFTEISTAASNNFEISNNTEQQNTTDQYVLNTNTRKIHIPSCSSVATIKSKNYATSNLSIAELEAQGYQRCGRCLK